GSRPPHLSLAAGYAGPLLTQRAAFGPAGRRCSLEKWVAPAARTRSAFALLAELQCGRCESACQFACGRREGVHCLSECVDRRFQLDGEHCLVDRFARASSTYESADHDLVRAVDHYGHVAHVGLYDVALRGLR